MPRRKVSGMRTTGRLSDWHGNPSQHCIAESSLMCHCHFALCWKTVLFEILGTLCDRAQPSLTSLPLSHTHGDVFIRTVTRAPCPRWSRLYQCHQPAGTRQQLASSGLHRPCYRTSDPDMTSSGCSLLLVCKPVPLTYPAAPLLTT